MANFSRLVWTLMIMGGQKGWNFPSLDAWSYNLLSFKLFSHKLKFTKSLSLLCKDLDYFIVWPHPTTQFSQWIIKKSLHLLCYCLSIYRIFPVTAEKKNRGKKLQKKEKKNLKKGRDREKEREKIDNHQK